MYCLRLVIDIRINVGRLSFDVYERTLQCKDTVAEFMHLLVQCIYPHASL